MYPHPFPFLHPLPKLSSPASKVRSLLCLHTQHSLQGYGRGSLSRPPGGPRTRRSPPAEAAPPPRTLRTRPPLLAPGGRPTLSRSWPPPTGAGPSPGSPGHAWKRRKRPEINSVSLYESSSGLDPLLSAKNHHISRVSLSLPPPTDRGPSPGSVRPSQRRQALRSVLCRLLHILISLRGWFL